MAAINTIRIVNKLAQSLTVTIDSGNGRLQKIPILPHRVSDPVSANTLTEYTRGLERNGHVRFVQA